MQLYRNQRAPPMGPMGRRGLGRLIGDFGIKGQLIELRTNHIQITAADTDAYFYEYTVSISSEDGTVVNAKGNIGRKVIDTICKTYQHFGKNMVYDEEKSLFTVGPLQLPHVGPLPALPTKLECTVVVEELSFNSANQGSKAYKVSINSANRIPIQAIANATHEGIDSVHYQDAVRVLDIILRKLAAKPGCHYVGQSFFHNLCNFTDLGGGVSGWRGFHSSLRTTQDGLSLNIDVSTTTMIQPGPVLSFLLWNQNVLNFSEIDWVKAKRTLKNLIIKNEISNAEQKITGLSDKICKEQTFSFKPRNEDGSLQDPIEITVYDYFTRQRGIHLSYSGDYPCINVGKPKRPNFIPIEHCELVSLQRYTKALTNQQRSTLMEYSRQNPKERMSELNWLLCRSHYNKDPLLRSCGVTITNCFKSVDGRVLSPPELTVGNGYVIPRDGRWNYNNKTLFEPKKIEHWAVVNFSTSENMAKLILYLKRCGKTKGLTFEDPHDVFGEDLLFQNNPASVRVEVMFEKIMSLLPAKPEFLLCVLPEKKNCALYGPWKRMNLSQHGIVTQCIAPLNKLNDQYLTNVVLKINAKMGGLNSSLTSEVQEQLPVVSSVPTLIVGMDVSHGSPGRDVPSIAAIVGSREWPGISKYGAVVRTQTPKTEMIDSLYKEGEKGEDLGIFRELLVGFFQSSRKRRPEQIIIFRDGVSESQFNQVLNIEFEQIIQACKHLDETWNPKFTFLVAQKNHHTRFFQFNNPCNVPPGTVVDTEICHPTNIDFYMCAQYGRIGTSRPTHYHVLHDDIGFSLDDLQELVHSLSYVNQRSTTAISIVAPIRYAHLAASQVSQFIQFDELSETASSHDGVTSSSDRSIPQLPQLDPKMSKKMFFC